MEITFLVGNGFDLACGLKTRFTDAYEVYVKTDSINDNIQFFKDTLLVDGFKNWADFEMALPKFGEELNDFDKFEECVLDFTEFLDDYLQQQQDSINIEDCKSKLGDVMTGYIYTIQNYCLYASKTALTSLNTCEDYSSICNFITFNYTNTLEKCLKAVARNIRKGVNSNVYSYTIPTHIHSTLGNGIILGLDDENLYKDIPCYDESILKALVDKLYINSNYSNITNQALSTLTSSTIVVILGWSMGQSDSFWVNNLKKLFADKPSLQIVYVPYYDEPINRKLPSRAIILEKNQKDFMLDKLDVPKDKWETEEKRIHIIIDKKYMDLEFISKSSKKLVTA